MQVVPILLLWTLTFASWCFARFDGGFHPWFLVYVCLIVSLYVTYVYVVGKQVTRINRELSSDRLEVGNNLTVSIHIQLPMWLKVPYILIEDAVPSSLRSAFYEQKQAVYPGLSRRLRVTYQIPNLRRGVHTFTNIQAETGDIFGLVRRRKWHFLEDEITVYPKIIPIRGWRDKQQYYGMGQHAPLRNQSMDGNQVYGVREYARGDRLSRIHWPATARTNLLKSKEFEATVDQNVVIFFNHTITKHAFRTDASFELAVTCAASLTKYALGQHLGVQFVSIGAERKHFVLSQSNDSFYKLMEHFVRVEQAGTKGFYESIEPDFAKLQKGQLVVIITPVFDAAMQVTLTHLYSRGIQVECFWCDAEQSNINQSNSDFNTSAQTGFAMYRIRSERELMDLQREEHRRALVR